MLPPIFIMIRLSKRLAAVANCVSRGARVIDVGTDHGQIPVWLVQAGISPKVYATDIRPGPLRRARELTEETETEDFIELRICDGLDGFADGDADTIIISGLGGESIVGILSRAAWVKNGVMLILQPQSKIEVLRRWLSENGLLVISERLVRDGGRIYPVLCAEGGTAAFYTQAEFFMGLYDQVKDEALFIEYLEALCIRARKAASFDAEAAELLRQYDAMKERLTHDNGL